MSNLMERTVERLGIKKLVESDDTFDQQAAGESKEEISEFIEDIEDINDPAKLALMYADILSSGDGGIAENPSAYSFLYAIKQTKDKSIQRAFIKAEKQNVLNSIDDGYADAISDLEVACEILGFKMPKIKIQMDDEFEECSAH